VPAEKTSDLNLTKSISSQQAITSILALKKIPDNFTLDGLSSKTFFQPQLQNRLFLRGSQLCLPLSVNELPVNLVIYGGPGTEFFLNRNMAGSWTSHYQEGDSKFLIFSTILDLLRYSSSHTFSGSLAFLVGEEFPNHRWLEVLQWIHKKNFTEITVPYSTAPWLFSLRLYCSLINIENSKLSISFEGSTYSPFIALTFKSFDSDFATTYSAFIAELNKTSRQGIKKYLANPNTYEENSLLEKYFLFNSENRSLATKTFKCLTCHNTPNNARALLDAVIKTWPVTIPVKYLSLL
jgi:hypothetical protein